MTILPRSSRLLASSSSSRGRRSSGDTGDESDESDDAAQVLQHNLEKEGVSFLWNVEVKDCQDATICFGGGCSRRRRIRKRR